jgi:RHS repeat-associated protein
VLSQSGVEVKSCHRALARIAASVALCATFLLGHSVVHATEFSSADYNLYVGDFNGDGRSDLLYIGKTPDKPSGIALADANGIPQMGFQSWPADYLNIPWSSGAYKAVIGDFNGDGCSDILLQAQTPGTSYVLLANCNAANGPVGQITGISQAIPESYLGLNWSADQHRILAGDFDGDGKSDLLLQATAPGGTTAIVLADGSGNLFTRSSSNCWSGGPQQCWGDGYQGFNWSTKAVTVYVGDFNGDHKTDLLVITRPTFVMIDYDVPFPVPKFAANSDGILLAQSIDSAGTIIRSVNQLFNYNGLGANFSPLITNIVVGDFNGDGYADILIQSKGSGRSNLILYSSGSSGQLGNATTPAANVASWSANNYQMLVGHFGNSSASVLYLQATSAGGGNYFTSNISSGSVTASASTLQIAANATQPANGVGVTVGSADVTQNGTGRYTIPLNLPRGTAGMSPELALQYEHTGKNGLLGVGWQIAGLSVITRCPYTYAQDGLTLGVQYSAADPYCLDGNRLRLTSGSQGADGSQYRTELETYSLVIAHGTGANGPQWFEVRRKDGQISEYGNTSDSNIPGTGGTRVWALNRVRDRAEGLSSGNYIAFSYVNDTAHGSYRPNQISYAGNTSQGIAPPYTVQFNYQPRNSGELLTHNYVGQTITEINRLQSIQVQYGNTVVRSWTFGYDQTATMSHFSRITSIQECGENNDCFPASTFNWSTAQMSGAMPAFSSTAQGYDWSMDAFSEYGAFENVMQGDINGDGIPDTVTYYYNGAQQPASCSFSVVYGAPHGQPISGSVPVPGDCMQQSLAGVMDVDLDGKDDVLLGNGTYLHQRTDGTLAVDTTPITSAANVDVDGDGYLDLVFIGNPTNNSAPNSNTVYVAIRNHDGSPGYSSPVPAWTAPAGTNILLPFWAQGNGYQWRTVIRTSDFDGDGRGDLLIQTSGGWQVLYSNGSGFTAGDLIVSKTYPSGTGTSYVTPIPIDVNGDGCTDLAYPDNVSNPTWQLAISACSAGSSGFAFQDTGITDPADTGTGSGWVPRSNASAVDINVDGYQDLAFYTTGSVLQIAYSTGSGLSPAFTATGPYFGDRDGDGLPDQMGCGPAPCYGYVYAMVGPKPDFLTSATDGFGNTVNFTYAPLTDSTVYTRGQGQTGPTQDVSGSMYVVKQLQSTDGVGGNFSLTYSYSGAHRNVQGRGFLGFTTRTITDSRTGFITTETYNNTTNADGSAWEFAGTLYERKVQQWAGGPTLSDTVNHWVSIAPDGASNRRYPYIQTQTVTSYELNNSGTPITTKTTNTTIDNYGTPYDVVVTTTENSSGLHSGSSRTQESYSPYVMNDTADWCLSKPTSTQVKSSHTLTDGAQVIQSISQTWDGYHCRLSDKNLDVGSAWEFDTHYDYDGWNNVSDQVVKATNLPQSQRITYFDYQTGAAVPGQLLMRLTNALSQTTQYTWDNTRGLKASETDPNGLTTFWYYDDFGRLARQVRPDGTGSRLTYSPCNASTSFCGDGLLRDMVQVDERNVNDQIISYQYVFYDSLGRVKYDETLGFSGALSVVETLYDSLGNVASRSNPYYAGSDRYQGTSFTYDLYGRVTEAQQPTSDANPQLATTTTTYNGLTVTGTDPNGHGRTETSDAWGDVIRVVDASGNTTNYTFDALSNLKSTTDANGNQITLSYTDRGFKLTSTDPDLGAWSYSYDGAGEMLTQTDAKSQVTQFHYDALGRMDNRTDPGASSPDTTWSWDTAANGIGQLASVTGPNGYSEKYSYGSANSIAAGKLIATATTEGGTNYAVNYGFDPMLGKLQTITYPMSAWPGPTSKRLEVYYDYQNGYLRDVKDYTGGTAGTVYWQANYQDARGHVTQEVYGNGEQSNLYFDETNGRLDSIATGPGGGTATQNLTYTWDAVGNLLTREDANQGLTENMGYDALDRLSTVSLNGTQTLSVAYDALGNITSKSDVGAYNYTAQQSGCNYAGITAQPHAVRNAGGTVYCYDGDGNMISRAGATVAWYPYNQPQTINQSGGNYSTFYYAPDRSRYRQTSLNGSTTEDRFYVAGLFEQLNSSTVGTEYRNYIVANGKKVAIRVLSGSRNDTLYLHDDHLGSTGAISNQSGAVQIQESFDAWGKRSGSAWTGTPSSTDLSTINTTTHLAFTGQEQLDNLSLVDLNGRVYDPTIARFMSADPYVQAPYESQSLNRYSYTFDNPLNATDPTGFESNDPEPQGAPGACTGTRVVGDSVGCGFVQSSDYKGTAATIGAQLPGSRAVNSDATNNTAQQGPNPPENDREKREQSTNPDEVLVRAPKEASQQSGWFLRTIVRVAEIVIPGYWSANRALENFGSGHPWWGLAYAAASVGEVALAVATFGVSAEAFAGGRSAAFAARGLITAEEAEPPIRVFWSGGDRAKQAAAAWAKANGGVTLEMTNEGRRLERVTPGLDWLTEALPKWQKASAFFARGASGAVHVFQYSRPDRGMPLESIWREVEFPILQRQGNPIVYHVITDDGVAVLR